MSQERPSVRMSVEEESAIADLRADHRTTQSVLKSLAESFEKFAASVEKRFSGTEDKLAKMAEEKQFSWGKMLSFIGSGLGIAAAVTALIALSTDNKLAPIITQNTVSINERHQNAEGIRTQREDFEREKERTRAQAEADHIQAAVQADRAKEMYFALHGHYPAD